MELRVIVIAVVSLAVVSLSFLAQGQIQKSSEAIKSEVNLLDQTPTQRHPVNASFSSYSRPAESSSELLSPSLPVDNARQATPERPANVETDKNQEDEGEMLEPQSLIERGLKAALPTLSNSEPSVDSTSTTESVPSAATAGESLLVPDEGLEPLENVSLDPPGSGDLEAKLNAANTSADSIPAESDSEGVVLVDEAPNGELHITPLHETSPASGIAATQDVAIDEATAADAGTMAADAENPKSTSETPLRDIPPSVGQIARDHLNYGNSLARRGSLYSARQEFFSGLRLVIESLDHVNGLSSHRENYDLAIMALNEAEDFVPASGDQASRSVARIAELHRSKVLSPEQTQTFTPMAAMQAYFAFAQSHFSAACGHTPVASELLYGLGKLYTVKASQEASGEPSDLAVTLLMHEAALHVDPNNYLSANELGVALARLGHYEAARAALLHSVATHASPEAWLNLSVVHQQLGETQLADMAMAEHRSALSKAGQESVAQQQIRWMSPNDFAAAEQVNFEGSHTAGGATAIPTTAGTTAQPAAADSSFWSKFKKTLGR